jgi:hypothetical protein
MKQPKPIGRQYNDIVTNVNNGIYQIPKFQRDFVWSKEQTAKLIDSLLKGFPIGSFILWKTNQRLKSLKKIGGKILNEANDGDYVYYILDGQQRMTSLYLALEGVEIGKNNYKEIYIDIEKDIETDDEICTLEKTDRCITFYELINERISHFYKTFTDDDVEKIEDLRDHIKNYEFSTIEIENQPMEKIAEIFTRINVGGKVLTLFEIMNAKVYSEDILDGDGNITHKGFDLEDKFETLIDDLKYGGYETIGENKSIILQLMSLILLKNAKREAILSIDKDEFIAEWADTIECMKLAIDKIIDYFKITASKLLPYYVLIVPIAYFYKINRSKPPSKSQLKDIEKYFFRSAISWRFSSSVESKLNTDIKIIERIKNNEIIDFDKELPIPNKSKSYFVDTLKENFSASNAFDKAVICIMAYAEPKKFSDNSKVRLDNSYLSMSTSKNYHHFFPKAYLKRMKNDENANALSNITLVDDFLNKRVIKDKEPQKYITDFQKSNSDINESLKSHFIELSGFGVLENDYDLFLNQRASMLADEILKRI